MLTTFSKLCLLGAAAVAYAVQAVYFTHMLQLNSYRDERYAKWCGDNGSQLTSWRRLIPALLLLLALIPSYLNHGEGPTDYTVFHFVAAGVLLINAGLCFPKKAKKPLVVTARVKRLFAAEGLVLAAALGLAYVFDSWRTLFWLGLFLCVVWFWVRVAARLTAPLEKALANRYIRDAERRVAAMPQLMVIGITGSYGKTSTKTFLQALLSVKYNVLMTPESFNTTLGVTRTVREQLRPTHQIFLAEMGAKNVGDIREICDLVHPKMGIITSIGEQHLETFKSVDNIIRTKFELADALPADGVLFTNEDNPYIRDRAVTTTRVGYGLTAGDYTADRVRVDAHGTHFCVHAPNGESAEYTTRLLGAHNIQNLVGCVAVAHKLGIPLADLAYPIRLLKPVPHRLELLPNGYIDDAYNANPAGFRSALDVLSQFKGQRVLVTPGMVELGEEQERLNRELGAYAASRCDWAVLVGERQAPPLKEGLLSAGFPPERVLVAADLQMGLALLRQLPAAEQRIVLLENDLPDNF